MLFEQLFIIMASTSNLKSKRRTSSDSDSDSESLKRKCNVPRRQVNPQKFRTEWKLKSEFNAWLVELKGE